MLEYKVVSAYSATGLNTKVAVLINDGWKLVGGHTVVEVHRQNRYAGSQHMDVLIESEYSQTMIKE